MRINKIVFKKITFCFLLIALFSCKVVAKNDLQLEKLNGKVKFVIEKSYSVKVNNLRVEKSSMNETYTKKVFNEIGNLTESYILNKDGIKVTTSLFRYDDKNRKEVELRYNSNSTLYLIVKYSYDKNGNIVEKISSNNKGLSIAKDTYKYDSQSCIIENITFINEKSENSSSIFFVILNESTTIFYKNDKNGNALQEDITRNNFGQSILSQIQNEYDSSGNLISLTEERGGIATKIIYKYELFDNNRNWIKLTKSWGNGIPINITEREIVYY
jgi:hypothetical protein